MVRIYHRKNSPWRSTATVAWLLTVLIALFSPLAAAIPPPPERPPHNVNLPDSGCAVKVEDEVRAYDFVTVRFSGTKGSKLALELTGDLAHQLQFDLRAFRDTPGDSCNDRSRISTRLASGGRRLSSVRGDGCRSGADWSIDSIHTGYIQGAAMKLGKVCTAHLKLCSGMERF